MNFRRPPKVSEEVQNTHAILMTSVGTHEDKGPAEQHLINLYVSLPKAIMLAGCKDGKSCLTFFDETTKP